MRRSTNIVAEITSKLIVEGSYEYSVGYSWHCDGCSLQEKSAFWIQNFGMHVLVPLFLYQLFKTELCTFHKFTVNSFLFLVFSLPIFSSPSALGSFLAPDWVLSCSAPPWCIIGVGVGWEFFQFN
ncbi:hypothetical protein HN51_026098 [Arachis hypogaea]|nr:uncharacterized protein DS421_7g218270 [Arachis hypogaea]